jgi:hypothetical protein
MIGAMPKTGAERPASALMDAGEGKEGYDPPTFSSVSNS